MLDDSNRDGHYYMQLRAGEKFRPVPNLTDSNYSHIDMETTDSAAAISTDFNYSYGIEKESLS